MCKKIISLVLLVVVFAASQSFGALAFTNFLGTTANGLWTNGSNWNTGIPVDNRTDANPMMSAKIYNNLGVGNVACLITDGMNLSTYKLRIGDGKANSELDMSGGVLNITSTENTNDLILSNTSTSTNAIFKMTGGIVNLAGMLKINQGNTANGVQLQLYGGTFNAGSYGIGGTKLAQIDITLGQLVLPGDVTYAVGLDISDGQIVGYGGTRTVSAFFDGTHTIVSVPEPATIALLSVCLALIRKK